VPGNSAVTVSRDVSLNVTLSPGYVLILDSADAVR
jgi:hypothetical protein